jgi:hypothetical protein
MWAEAREIETNDGVVAPAASRSGLRLGQTAYRGTKAAFMQCIGRIQVSPQIKYIYAN